MPARQQKVLCPTCGREFTRTIGGRGQPKIYDTEVCRNTSARLNQLRELFSVLMGPNPEDKDLPRSKQGLMIQPLARAKLTQDLFDLTNAVNPRMSKAKKAKLEAERRAWANMPGHALIES